MVEEIKTTESLIIFLLFVSGYVIHAHYKSMLVIHAYHVENY